MDVASLLSSSLSLLNNGLNKKKGRINDTACSLCITACVADVIWPRLVTSAKQQRRDRCSGPPTDSTNYRKCVLNFLSSWLANRQWLFNRPIVVRTQILEHRWGPRTRISAVFGRRTDLTEFSFVYCTDHCIKTRHNIFHRLSTKCRQTKSN